MRSTLARLTALAGLLAIAAPTLGQQQKPATVFDAVLGESGQKSPEVSTTELIRLLREGKAMVLDARPFREFAVSHIPSALNVSAKPGVAMSLYVSDVAEIGRLVGGRKDMPLVLYCNGPFAGRASALPRSCWTPASRTCAGISSAFRSGGRWGASR